METCERIIADSINKLEKIQYKRLIESHGANAINLFPEYFEKVKNSILSLLDTSSLSQNQKQTVAIELCHYLKKNIQQYPRTYRSFLWGHIKSWEFESSLVNHFINELQSKYEIASSRISTLLWSSFVSTYNTLANADKSTLFNILVYTVVISQLIESVQTAEIKTDQQRGKYCITPKREAFIEELFVSKIHAAMTEKLREQMGDFNAEDMVFVSSVLRQDSLKQNDWCIEGIKALLYLFSGDKTFALTEYPAIQKIIKEDDAVTFSRVIADMERVRQLLFLHMPEEFKHRLLDNINNYNDLQWIDLNLYNPINTISSGYPLEQAIVDGSVKIIELLLNSKVNLKTNAFFERPVSFLSMAIIKKRLDIAELLMEHDAPLYAEELADESPAQFQEYEALTNYNLPNFIFAEKLLCYKMQRQPLSIENATTLLLDACKINSDKLVKLLLELTPASGDVAYNNLELMYNKTPVFYAILHQRVSIIKLLLPKIDINKSYSVEYERPDSIQGLYERAFITPLYVAYAMLDRSDSAKAKKIIELLLENGATPLTIKVQTKSGLYSQATLDKNYNISYPKSHYKTIKSLIRYFYFAENISSFFYVSSLFLMQPPNSFMIIWSLSRALDIFLLIEEQEKKLQQTLILTLLLQIALYLIAKISIPIKNYLYREHSPEEVRIPATLKVRQKRPEQKSKKTKPDIRVNDVLRKGNIERQTKRLEEMKLSKEQFITEIKDAFNDLKCRFGYLDEYQAEVSNLRKIFEKLNSIKINFEPNAQVFVNDIEKRISKQYEIFEKQYIKVFQKLNGLSVPKILSDDEAQVVLEKRQKESDAGYAERHPKDKIKEPSSNKTQASLEYKLYQLFSYRQNPLEQACQEALPSNVRCIPL